MAQIIKDVTVARISLVSNKHTPAVPLATNEYAIFKMFGGVETDTAETVGSKPNTVITKDIETKLGDCINKLSQ